MFRRIIIENWQATLTLVSFALFGAVFVSVLIRTWLTPREKLDKIANLPLENDHE
jgi:hypothetical protein